jgi:hypothetical protein
MRLRPVRGTGSARLYTARVTTPERIADLARDLPPDKQAEVLDFVEFLRSRRSPPAARRGSLEALRATLASAPAADVDEPDWSPFDIEPAQVGDIELER